MISSFHNGVRTCIWSKTIYYWKAYQLDKPIGPWQQVSRHSRHSLVHSRIPNNGIQSPSHKSQVYSVPNIFVDNSQLHPSFPISSQNTTLIVWQWMLSYRVNLNMKNAAFIRFGKQQKLDKICFGNVYSESIKTASTVRIICVNIYQELKTQ